jgi:hypothetical protein
VKWLSVNADKILAAITAILAIGDWQHVWHLEWLTALAAVLTLISEWLGQMTLTPEPPAPTQPPRKS